MSIRVEAKCPCCNKRMYIHVNVHDADIEDCYDKRRAEEEAEKQARWNALTPEERENCQKYLDELMKNLREGK